LNNYKEQIKNFLDQVAKPARYLGGEQNEIIKDWTAVSCRFLFAFPDVYEVGMSHLGLQILYGAVNREADLLMERTFAPWTDMEAVLRQEQIPLFSLESGHAANAFDCLGFTLQHEMSYTNVLNMLNLGGIPLFAAQRGNEDILVIAGGPCASNVEPLAPFFDLVLLGEGEELLPLLLRKIGQHKSEHQGKMDKPALLRELARLQGIYVPSLYEPQYSSDGKLLAMQPLYPEVPAKVRKARLKDMDQAYFPEAPLVPYIEVVHDRMMTEVLRGCTRGCRFCQAGMIYRPVRERSCETLVRQARNIKKNTGHNEISLTSLSSSDYTCIKELVHTLIEDFREEQISVSLPSLRANHFSVELAKEIQKVRKTGFTFAPEAGSQRMRDIINKGVTEEALLDTIAGAVSAGWQQIKFYFMVGLPGETREDVEAIAALCEKVVSHGTRIIKEQGRFGSLKVTASASNFVPKAHTPFQWCGQASQEQFKDTHAFLKQRIRDRRISYRYHDAFTSMLEAVFARGDRRLAPVLVRAAQKGCRFDSWSEEFKPQLWQEAFDECSLDMQALASQTFDLDDVLPWSHLDYGIDPEFLKKEYKLALAEVTTPDCRYAGCAQCGICWDGEGGLDLKGKAEDL
jgi:radical SAM family uncharacterized protein